jgi:hypothetical protein
MPLASLNLKLCTIVAEANYGFTYQHVHTRRRNLDHLAFFEPVNLTLAEHVNFLTNYQFPRVIIVL